MSYTLPIAETFLAANSIYEVLKGSTILKDYLKKIEGPLADNFDLQNMSDFRSKTGAFFHAKSGFAFAALSKSKSFSNHALVTFRGTDLLADWLTDANAGLQVSKTGKIVHAGFNRTFAELAPQLKAFFTRNSVTTIHCVGHSLGGALATLAADYFETLGIAKTKLYTIGAPRVGLKPFASKITTTLAQENIFRLHHENDFVSHVPVWPFFHAPYGGNSCCIRGTRYNPFSAHKMENYGVSLESIKDWQSLRAPVPLPPNDYAVKNWLSMDGLMTLGHGSLTMLSAAIGYILKVACIGMQAVLIGGCTILDKLSYIMHAAYNTSKEVADWVTLLLKKTLKLFGKTIDKTQKITSQFIRWVFGLLHGAVARIVRVALAAVG